MDSEVKNAGASTYQLGATPNAGNKLLLEGGGHAGQPKEALCGCRRRPFKFFKMPSMSRKLKSLFCDQGFGGI